MSGTRPSAGSQMLHDRGIRLALGLAVVVAIPVAVLFYFQSRSLKDLEQTSAVVLRQLSSDAVDGLAKSIENALKRPHISVLLGIPGARVEPLDLEFIDPVFTQGLAESPFIDEFFIWTADKPGSPTGRWLVFDHASLGASGASAQRFREAPDGGGTLLADLQGMASMKRAIVAFTKELHGRKHYIQAQLRWSSQSREQLTSFVAFAVDAERLRREYFPAFVGAHLKGLQQPAGFPPLRVTLVDDNGNLVVPTEGGAAEAVVDERTFPLVFFDKELLEFAAPYEAHREIWRLRTSYGDATIPDIVSASTRPQFALMLLVAGVLGIGVFLIAGAAAREVRLAELKSNFVASVSHDLKTPLALIQLFAETLELGRVRSTDRAQEYYRIINGEARKLTRLIENLLDFSRMEAGLRPYTLEPTDIGALVQRVLSVMERQFAQGQFEVTTTVAPGLPAIMADGVAVERAVENLLANAMKYSGDSRRIDVTVPPAHGEVVVRVRDYGIGIARREQRKIFRKFYRVHHELGGGPQGTGLGLAIVDHTMRGHGGYVGVESEPGRGSTFTLHFPVPIQASQGVVDEAHSGDRGRAADAARPA
ncbi:MAG: HAMP domain-containing histidine kinase [Acidobacteria bacterium]|nr:HAMP domain-containing histidine kinase [Acidobacteriota bacterium]